MESQIAKLIEEKKDKEGKISCKNALEIASKTAISPLKVGEVASKLGVKITDCELGEFGKLELGTASAALYDERFKKLLDEKRRIFCKDGLEVAKDVCPKTIRATLKNFNIGVKYCELGCFKEKKSKKMVVKTKIWIENGDGKMLFGKGKTEILEAIDEVGSIKRASEILDMNYKKCWSHLKVLEDNLKEELFLTKQGGSGTELLPRTLELIAAYRELQKEIEEFANKRFKELFLTKKVK